MSIVLPAVLSIGCFVILLSTGRLVAQAASYMTSDAPVERKQALLAMVALSVVAVIVVALQFAEIINTINASGHDIY